jgi:hypothetical protein
MTGASGAASICRLDNTNFMRIGHDIIKLSTPPSLLLTFQMGLIMIERDNFVAALDAYLKKQIEEHFEDRKAPEAPAVETTSTVGGIPERFQNVKYDEVSRKEARDFLRRNNQSADGLTDAQIAASVYGLKEWLAIKNANQ